MPAPSGSLPGPSRTITVEPVTLPQREPVPLPSRPAEEPRREPVKEPVRSEARLA